MNTAESRIEFVPENVVSGTPVLSKEPFCVDVREHQLDYRIKSEGKVCWKNTQYLVLEVMIQASSRTFIHVSFLEKGEKQMELNYSIIPNRRITVAFDLQELSSRRWFLTPHPGNLKGHVMGRPTVLEAVDEIQLTTSYSRDGESFTIYSGYLSDALPDFKVEGEPLVDPFGQNRNFEWAQKIRSEEQLRQILRSEYEKYRKKTGYANPDWDEYGGCKRIKLDKTGYFHVANAGGRYWLADPVGNAFLSNGICYGSRMGVHGHVSGMENLFEWLPDEKDERFQDAWTSADSIPEFVKRNGEEAGKKKKMFNFARANMIRVFGSEWWDAWVTINAARLKEWGFNTISVCVNNYYDERVYDFLKKAKIPYTWTMKNFPKTEHMIFRDFPDVFSKEYREKCAEFARQLEPLADDAYMIGYFINNEPEWLVERTVNIAERLLVSDRELESKKEFVKYLQDKYKDIGSFNKAWKMSQKDFADLLEPIPEECLKKDCIQADLEEFKGILIREYNRVPQEAIQRICPHNMSLGMRYAGIAQKSDFAGNEYHDVFSFNCYKKDPTERIGLANACTDKPCIIGEWMVGASDESLFCSALITCPDQRQRGIAAARYLQKVYSNPQMVGAHYFEYNDQPLLGRFDGEAMPHGLIDVCNRPKQEFIDILSDVNSRIYEIAAGTKHYETESPVFTTAF